MYIYIYIYIYVYLQRKKPDAAAEKARETARSPLRGDPQHETRRLEQALRTTFYVRLVLVLPPIYIYIYIYIYM
jgi:hypothetical protein